MLINTFYVQVGIVCPTRMPEFFLITLMSGSESTRHHQRDFIITLPTNVDVCTIQPRISAGNAAGTTPIETVVVGKLRSKLLIRTELINSIFLTFLPIMIADYFSISVQCTRFLTPSSPSLKA